MDRMKTKGRRVMIAVAGLGLLVILGAGYAARNRLLEEWWLYRLEHGDEGAKKAAARRLGCVGGRRSVGPLWKQIRAPLESYVLGGAPPGTFSDVPKIDFSGNEFCVALTKLGEPALLELTEALADDSPAVAAVAGHLLKRAYDGYNYAPPYVEFPLPQRPRLASPRGDSVYSGPTVVLCSERGAGWIASFRLSLTGALTEARTALSTLADDRGVEESTRRAASGARARVDERLQLLSNEQRRKREAAFQRMRARRASASGEDVRAIPR